MTRPAPFDGTLLRVSEDALPRMRRMLVYLRGRRVLPPRARMVEYAGGYVALNVSRAHAETLIAACGLRSAEA